MMVNDCWKTESGLYKCSECWFEANGQKVQGTWERTLAQIFEKLGISWISHKRYLEYVRLGKKQRYTPDFYLKEYNTYVEVKGHWWGNDQKKMKLVSEQNCDCRILLIHGQDYFRIKKEPEVLFEYLPCVAHQ
jgi:hypothetical protein